MTPTVAFARPVRLASSARVAGPSWRRLRRTIEVFRRRSPSVEAGRSAVVVIRTHSTGSADAVQVLERELVELLDRRALGAEDLGVGELPLQELLPALAGGQGRLGELGQLGGLERGLDLGVGAERLHLLAQDEV